MGFFIVLEKVASQFLNFNKIFLKISDLFFEFYSSIKKNRLYAKNRALVLPMKATSFYEWSTA